MLTFLKQYLLIGSGGFRKYFTNTSWLFMERVISLSITLVMGIYTARYLGADNFGLFNYTRSFATIVMTIAPLGIDSLLAHYLHQSPEHKNRIMGTALLIRSGGSLVCLSLVFLINRLVGHDAYTSLLVMVVAAATLFESFNILGQFFSSRIQAKYHVYGEVTKTVVSALVKILLILNGASLIWFAVVLVIENLVYALVALSIYSVKFESVWRWQADVGYLKGLLQDSWPLGLTGLVFMIYLKIDQVMLRIMLGNEAVGYYAAALRLSESMYFIPTVICSSLLPSILNARRTGEAPYYERLQRLFTLMVVIALSVAIPVSFLGEWIITFLFGEAYRPAAAVLVIHIWTGVFVSLGIAASSWFVAERLQKLTLLRTFAGVILNVTLNLILIPRLGIKGAALSTLISQLFSAYLMNSWSPRTRPVFKMQTKALVGLGPLRKALSYF